MSRALTRVDRLIAYRGLDLLIVALVATVVLASAAFFVAEVGANPGVQSYGDALWWALNTLTGGNTDIAPVTVEGRMATGSLLIVGVGLFTGITATLISFVLAGHRDQARSDPATSNLRHLSALREASILTDAEFEAFVGRVAQELVAEMPVRRPR